MYVRSEPLGAARCRRSLVLSPLRGSTPLKHNGHGDGEVIIYLREHLLDSMEPAATEASLCCLGFLHSGALSAVNMTLNGEDVGGCRPHPDAGGSQGCGRGGSDPVWIFCFDPWAFSAGAHRKSVSLVDVKVQTYTCLHGEGGGGAIVALNQQKKTIDKNDIITIIVDWIVTRQFRFLNFLSFKVR